MKTTILRGFLVIVMAGVLCGLPAPAPVRAGGSGRWTNVPPNLDGATPPYEWGNALELVFTKFRVRYENDEQFLYFLIDVTDETAVPPAISNLEDFAIGFDTNLDGVDELLYALGYDDPNPLMQAHLLESGNYSFLLPCLSYGKAGFGPSLSSVTSHRIYEAAIRLSEIGVLPGHSVTASFLVISQNSSIVEKHINNILGLASPLVAYIYNTPAGYTDAQAFNTILYNTAGIFAETIPLGQVELIDFSPYRAILVGNDTSSARMNWLGTAAAVQKIRQSNKPVLGIGWGGSALFGLLGADINGSHVASAGTGTQVQPTRATEHPGWNTPAPITVSSSPVTLYSTPVSTTVVYYPDINLLWQSLTSLGTTPGDDNYVSIIGQQVNGTCYTLWGFRGQPGLLTDDGKKLFSNLAWQPACRPAVLYLGWGDTTLKNSLSNLLTKGGFPHTLASASNAASLNYSGYQEILLGWDVPDSAWTNVNNLLAVSNSRLPVVGMGEGGANLLRRLGVPMADTNSGPLAFQKEAELFNPLLPAMRRPYPVAVSSSLIEYFDNTANGVKLFGVNPSTILRDETAIGYLVDVPEVQVFATQPYRGVCYQLYGFNSYPDYMTAQAKGLLRNMLAAPTCNYPAFLPVLKR